MMILMKTTIVATMMVAMVAAMMVAIMVAMMLVTMVARMTLMMMMEMKTIITWTLLEMMRLQKTTNCHNNFMNLAWRDKRRTRVKQT